MLLEWGHCCRSRSTSANNQQSRRRTHTYSLMPKRRRAASESACPPTKRSCIHLQGDCSLPLTQDNLARLQAAYPPPPQSMSRRTPSPKRINNNLDQRDKLEAYRIHVDQ